MSGANEQDVAALRLGEAAQWQARLSSDTASEADWLGFEQWIVLPGAREAYDAVEALDLDIETHAPALAAHLDDLERSDLSEHGPVIALGARRRPRPVVRTWLIGALAAGVAALAFGPMLLNRPPVWTSYVAPKDAAREVTLADGSRISLNRGSAIRVSLRAHERRVEMAESEAVFDVAKDPSRPFLIAVGDRQVRVVGTEFDIFDHAGRTVVTVRRGVVSVGPRAGGGAPVRLTVGQQLVRRTAGDLSQVRRVDADAAFAWRQGRLVYRDAALDDVASDLSRTFGVQIHTTPQTAALRFTGVLAIDGRDAVLHRLEAYLPVKATPEGAAIVLRPRMAR